MTAFVKKFLQNESGATVIEYGLIAALISIIAIVAMTQIGDRLNAIFSNVNNHLAAVPNN